MTDKQLVCQMAVEIFLAHRGISFPAAVKMAVQLFAEVQKQYATLIPAPVIKRTSRKRR